MKVIFSQEQTELRHVLRRFLQEKSAESSVREQMESIEGYDRQVWQQMSEQLGLQSLIIPELAGGEGFGYLELSILMEEMGRALLCAPFFSTIVLAANALIHSEDNDAQAQWLPKIAAGAITATLAHTEENGSWDVNDVHATATPHNERWAISGEKFFVLDGHTADLIILSARTSNGVSLFVVQGSAKGLTRTPMATMDQTRKQASLEFDGVEATLIGVNGNGPEVLRRVLDLAAIALAAEQVGAAQKCLEMAVDYAKLREQFGRSIGSFQAIKHKCADMLLDVESARATAYHASWCADDADEELSTIASLAKSFCSDAFTRTASENIQIHGGIGFTWEHPAHLYFKRAKSSDSLLGDSTYHRDLLATRIGI